MTNKSAIAALVWLGRDVPREQQLSYWRSTHAQKAARTRGVLEYRQHHFDQNSLGHWPLVAGIDTEIHPEHRIDGVEEVILNTRAVKYHRKLTSAEAVEAFKKIEWHVTKLATSHWLSFAQSRKASYREVVLIRRKPHVQLPEFHAFINHLLTPAIASAPGIAEMHYHLFESAQQREARSSYQAMLIIAAADSTMLKKALTSTSFQATESAQQAYCEAIHAYPVEDSYIFTKSGRPTLPQTKAERKPPLEPVRRKLPPAPARARWTSSGIPFPPVQRIPLSGYGPEDVIADDQGRLLCGVEDGRILRIHPERGSEEVIGNTGGRPLGLELLPDGQLLICDAHKGLLQLNKETGKIETLVQYVDGIPLRFCSNAAAAKDGTIWFTESSDRYDFEQYTGALLEHRPSGRLFKRYPNGQAEVVLEGLYFANGLILSSDEQAVIFSETGGYRINRLWIRGADAGKRELLVDNLPGFPDNISRLQDGKFWVAIVTNRNSLLDRLGTMPAFLRRLLWRVPAGWQPAATKTA
ncbi:strictosidine synthase [Planococcus antarcticus DSM 14505]|uniref:Strictosidine synthase n=1 Tax=Planococcus antarcticus DSM 14505 TaxID=1185653 RepID=A0AA87IP28_9BACL|nr:SMP-30/gluconolactonase/LRE family protein [Planococcus antarcticus]EIM07073.1 strictosidine synthase [Planococcus antarcticus DSM 14505]